MFSSGGADFQLPSSASPLSYTEVFDREFPAYLAMGMSSEDYWHGPAKLVKAYREAYRMRTKHENYNAWLQGAYIYRALVAASPALNPMIKNPNIVECYPSEPLPTTEEDLRKKEKADNEAAQQEILEKLQTWAAVVNKKQNKG